MASNNALQFKIQFIEDSTSLNTVVKNVTERLNNIKISLGAKNFDVSGLEQQLNKLATTIENINSKFSNVGSASSFKGLDNEAKSATNDMGRLAYQLERVLRVLESGNMRGFTKNIEEATNAAKALVDELSRLDTKFARNLGLNIGRGMIRETEKQEKAAQKAAQAQEDAAKRSEQAMSGAEAKTQALVASLNAVGAAAKTAGEAGSKLGAGFEFVGTHMAGFSVAKEEIAKITAELRELERGSKAATGLGIDTSRAQELKETLTFMQNIYKQIADENSRTKGYLNIGGMFYSGLDVKRAFGGASALIDSRTERKSLEDVMKLYGQLEEMRNRLQSVPAKAFGVDGMAERIKGITSRVETLMSEIKAAPDHIAKSTFYNQSFKALEKDFNDLMRSQTQAERESAKETQNVENAQKKVQQQINANVEAAEKLVSKLRELRNINTAFPNGGGAEGYAAGLRQLMQLNRERREMQNLLNQRDPTRLMGFAGSDRLTSWSNTFKEGMKAVEDGMNRVVANNKIDNLLADVGKRLENINKMAIDAPSRGLTDLATKAHDSIDALERVKRELQSLKDTGLTTTGLTKAQYFAGGDMARAMQESQRLYSQGRREIDAVDEKRRRDNIKTTTNEINRLKDVMKQLESLRGKNPEIKVQGVEFAIEKVRRFIEVLERAKEQGNAMTLRSTNEFSAQNSAATISRLSQEVDAAARHSQQMAEAQQRMGQAIAQATGEARQQSQVLSDLRSMAAQYISVWGATSFVKEVAQVTGELELQQKSMEVIIGSAGKAQELFEDIKSMSQMSPYTFQDLLKTTRQLAAFGVETKDLYSTMKMLSDVGAGLDVDVQRLVLAYGHVKSAGVLTGIQRRQLETAGIGITKELAKLYNEQYRASGSDERVTPEDVFKRITKREVKFEDVEKVFKRITGPGGQFYEMQLKQYDTLGGKLRNLRNNYNIMLDEIGKAHMGLLSGGVDMLNSIMENWRKWADVIKVVGAGLIAVKVAQTSLSKATLAHRAATAAQMATYRENAVLQRAGAIAPMADNARVLDVGYAQQIQNSNLSRLQKARAVMYKNVLPDARQLLLLEQGFKPVYAERVAQMGAMNLWLQRMKLSAMSFFATMKAGIIALATNPMTWIFAAVSGIMAMVNSMQEAKRAKEEMEKDIRETKGEDVASIQSSLDSLRKQYDYTRDEEGHVKFKVDISTDEARDIMEQVDAELQKFDPLYKGTLFDLESMRDEKEKAAAMVEELEDIKAGKQAVGDAANGIAKAVGETGDRTLGIEFDDDLIEDIEDYADAISEAYDKIHGNAAKFRSAVYSLHEMSDVDKGLEGVKKFADNAVAQNENAYASSFEEVLQRMVREGIWEKYGYGKDLNQMFMDQTAIQNGEKNLLNGDYFIDFQKVEKAMHEYQKELVQLEDVFGDIMEAASKGGDSNGKKRAKALMEFVKTIMDKTSITDPKIRQFLEDKIVRGIVLGWGEGAPYLDDLMTTVYPEVVRERLAQEAATLQQALMDEGMDFSKGLTGDDLKKARDRWNKEINDEMFQSMGYQVYNVNGQLDKIKDETFQKFVTVEVEPNINLKSWQKKIVEAIGAENWDEVKTFIGVNVDADVSLEEFLKKTQEKYGEAKKTAELLAKSIDIKTKLGIKIDADVAFGSAKGVEKVYDALMRSRVKASLEGRGKEWADMYGELYDAVDQMYMLIMAGKKAGLDTGGISKGGVNANKEEKPKKEKKSGKDPAKEAEDKEVKRHRERIRIMQEMRGEYKKFRERMGESWALQETKNLYVELHGKNGPISEEELASNIKDYENWAKAEADAIQKNAKIRSQETKDELKTQAQKLAANAREIRLQESANKLLGEMNSDLEDLSFRFDKMKKIYAATGDKEETIAVSGLGIGVEAGNFANVLEEFLVQKLGIEMQDLVNEFIGEEGEAPFDIDFESVGKMSEKEIEEYVKDMFGNPAQREYVDAITSWLKEYRRSVKNYEKEILDTYTKIVGSAKDYESQMAQIEADRLTQVAKVNQMEEGADKERAKRMINADAALRMIKIDDAYLQLMSGLFRGSQDELNSLEERLTGALAEAMLSGKISADEYAKEIMELNNAMEKAKDKNFKEWFEKGIFDSRSQEEITKDMMEAAQSKIQQGADLIQRGRKRGDEAMIAKGEGLVKEGNVEMDEANKRERRLRQINNVINKTIEALNQFKEAIDFLSGVLDSLGAGTGFTEDASTLLGSVAGGASTINGITKALGATGPWGAAAGAALGLISGIAQVHDAQLQRKIDAIKEDTEKMSNTIENIKALRERALGYDNGSLRSMLANYYTNQIHNFQDYGNDIDNRFFNSGSNAIIAMAGYYSRYSMGNGYATELSLLQEQREKILEMYDLEDAKKKKSKEELESYKTQIADLDEQIMFFTQDLANTLWGIDIKGWAGQLGDALMTAFENGTSAASAFHDAVQDIMRGVVRNMLTVGIIEPALQNLQEKLFGKNGKGGIFNADDVEGTMGATLAALGDWFKTDGPALMDAANEFFNGADDMMRQTLGYGMKESEKASNTVNSISSAASEETMGIVAGYLSRISQDVSVQRIMEEMFVNGSWPDYIEQVTTANNSLAAIDRSTTAMMEMMRDGNGALYERVENVSRRLDNFANGVDTITMR